MDKPSFRSAMLKRLGAVDPEVRRAAGQAVAGTVMALPELAGVRRLMLFLSMEDELDVDPLVDLSLEAGLEVYAPRTQRRSRSLVPARLSSLDAVVRGAYGIREPASDLSIEPDQLDAIVVPAVAFDLSGYRLGRGGGYYDRLVAGLEPGAIALVGVGYEFQIVDEVPREEHDQAVGLVATEQRVVRP